MARRDCLLLFRCLLNFINGRLVAVPALGLFHNSQSVLRGARHPRYQPHPQSPRPAARPDFWAPPDARQPLEPPPRHLRLRRLVCCIYWPNARSTKLSRPVEGASLSTRAADTFVFASDAWAALTCCGVLTRFVSARTAASRATDVALDTRTASFASAADFLALSAAARMLFCVFTSLQWSVPARHGGHAGVRAGS